MKSKFASWFKEQHGSRTDSGMARKTDKELRMMVLSGKLAESVLASRKAWDEKRESALYAWQARVSYNNSE